MEIEVHKGPAPTVPPNGTNGHGNGNGNDGIAVPVVEAPAPVTASEPVVAAETAEVIGEQGASADSESTGAPRNEGKKTPRLHNKQARQMKDDDPVVFRPWEVGPVVSKLVAVDLTTALAQRPEGNGRWSDRVRDAYGPARKTLDDIGEDELKRRLKNIVRSGEDGHRFACRQAKDIVNKLLTRLIYAIMPGVDEGLRVWFKDRVTRLDEELGWFCHADQYALELEEGRRRQKELEEGRRRQAEMQKVAEIARGTDEMLGALSLLGPDLVIKTSAPVKGGDQSEITAGSTVRGNVLGFAIGNGRNGNKYVAGIRFRVEDREVFVPISTTGWQMTRDENTAGFMARLRSHFSDSREFQLKVTEIGPDRKGGIRIVARLMSEMDVARPDNSKPVMLGIKFNDEVAGKVRWVGNEGVVVRLFAPDIELFVSAGDLAPDTALGDYRRGDKVEGVVIQGDKKPFAMKITVREECKVKGEQPLPEHIIHPERVEKIRSFATGRGLDLGERWNTLREHAERANRPGTLKPEEIELARAFFGEILKDVADVPAEISEAAAGVVTTRGAYREEQEAKRRKLDGQGVAEDKRPFCKNHDAPNGQRCDKRVEKAGDLCDRCAGKVRRMSAKSPRPPKPKEKGGEKQCKACRKGICRKH